MQLIEVTIRNFRGFREAAKIPVSPRITGITGKNDAGKSSILEALDIFFGDGNSKLDKGDFHIDCGNKPLEIRCRFTDLPDEFLLDASNVSSLSAEHLLDSSGTLTVLKRFTKTKLSKPEVCIIANHPTAEGWHDLHWLKKSDLKARARELGVLDSDITADRRTLAAWRTAIWGRADDLQMAEVELGISELQEDAKKIQGKLFAQMPLFALFKSDRQSKDSDPEAKDPIQQAVDLAKSEIKNRIEALEEEVQSRVIEMAKRTLEKLREMDERLADSLVPKFKSKPRWSFDFTLDDERGVPINKRGSGVRRLILLNFFRAEAERKIAAKDSPTPSVIYAFEEPETSQHPENQMLLMEAFSELAGSDACQVMLTTHVPALAGMLPVEGILSVERADEAVRICLGSDSDDILDRISKDLGVLPDFSPDRAKALVLVEGPGDVVFLRHTAEKLKEGGYIDKTLDEAGVRILIAGGCGTLKHWRTKQLPQQFRIPWGVVLDSDKGGQNEGDNKKEHRELCSVGAAAFITRKREPENYLLEGVVKIALPGCGEFTIENFNDAKKSIARAAKIRDSVVLERLWPKMTTQDIRDAERFEDDAGNERFELTEIIEKLLDLPSNQNF